MQLMWNTWILPSCFFFAVVWVATFCLPQVLGDAEKRRRACQWWDSNCSGLEMHRIEFIDTTNCEWGLEMTFSIVSKIKFPRDPNTCWESIWAPKICQMSRRYFGIIWMSQSTRKVQCYCFRSFLSLHTKSFSALEYLLPKRHLQRWRCLEG